MKIGDKFFGEKTPKRIENLTVEELLNARENAKVIHKGNTENVVLYPNGDLPCVFYKFGWSLTLKNVGKKNQSFIEQNGIWNQVSIDSGDNARNYLIRLEYFMGFELAVQTTLYFWNIDLKTLMIAYFQDFTEKLPVQATELNF